MELPQIKSIIYNFYNDTCVHFAYYIEEEYLNEQELQTENIDSDDAKEIYENYTAGIRYDLQKEQVVNAPVMKDFGTYMFIKMMRQTMNQSISLARLRKKISITSYMMKAFLHLMKTEKVCSIKIINGKKDIVSWIFCT